MHSDNKEMEEKFGALIIAVQNGHIDIARKIFDLSLEDARKNAIEQAVTIAEGTGYPRLAKAIGKLILTGDRGNKPLR